MRARSRTALGVAVLGGLFAALAAPAFGEGITETKWCANTNNPTPKQRVDGCTAMIITGRFSGRDLASLHVNRGNGHYAMGADERAIADYDQAAKLLPDFGGIYFNRGNSRARLGQLDQAIADYTTALAKFDPARQQASDKRDYLHRRALAHYRKKDLDRATADVSEAIRTDPAAFDSYMVRASIQADRKRFDAAIADYDAAAQIRPKDAELHLLRGNARRDRADVAKGDNEGALADYGRAIEYFDPAKQPARAKRDYYRTRGYLLSALDRYDPAIADFGEALALDPLDVDALLGRGGVHHNRGDLDLAIVDYDRASGFASRDARVFRNRGDAFRAKGDHPSAIADYGEAISLSPSYIRAYIGRASSYVKLGEFGRADADYEQALRLDPADASSWNNRCWALALADRLEAALKACDEALRLKPDHFEALDSRGLVHLKSGAFDKAIADYDAALALRPKQPAPLYGRGMARLRKGDAGGEADKAAAIALRPNIAAEYERFGVK